MNIVKFIESLTNSAEMVTFLVSMVPVVELRGAIPVGVSLGLPYWSALLYSVLGNMLPVPFIILFIRRIFAWMRVKIPKLNGFIDRMEKKAEKQRDFIKKWRFWGLMLFVAIPLPGTGAWTGALIAALLDMRLKGAILSIFLGVIIAGFLVLGITFGFVGVFL